MKEIDLSKNENQVAAGAIVGGTATLTSGTLISSGITTVISNASIPAAVKIGAFVGGAFASPVVGAAAIILGVGYLLDQATD